MESDVRRGNFRLLIERRFDGSHQAAAREIGVSPGRISQLIDPGQPFGERAARKIEERLSLPRGWLDTPAPQPGATRGPVPAPTVLPTLPQALQALLGTVSGLSGMRLTMARAALHQLVDHPEMLDDAAEQLAHLVAAETAARSKRSSAA